MGVALEVSGLDDVEEQKLVGWWGGSLSELKAELFNSRHRYR